MHETIFLETKLKARHTVRTLYDETRVLAIKEGKIPVLALADKSRPGLLLVMRPEDLKAVAAELVAIMTDETPHPEHH